MYLKENSNQFWEWLTQELTSQSLDNWCEQSSVASIKFWKNAGLYHALKNILPKWARVQQGRKDLGSLLGKCEQCRRSRPVLNTVSTVATWVARVIKLSGHSRLSARGDTKPWFLLSQILAIGSCTKHSDTWRARGSDLFFFFTQ